MKKQLYLILLIVIFFSDLQNIYGQKLILLKDNSRRDTLDYSVSYVGRFNFSYQVFAVDGYIYDINRERPITGVIIDSNLYKITKFDLNGNFIKSVRFPNILPNDSYIEQQTDGMHSFYRNTVIFKPVLEQNNLVLFIPSQFYAMTGYGNGASQAALYKFNKNLDSVKLTILGNFAQCMQTADGGYLIANKEYTDKPFPHDTGIVKVRKVDKDFNSLWTYQTDTMQLPVGLNPFSLRNEIALNEFDNNIYIAFCSWNTKCPGNSCKNYYSSAVDAGARSLIKINTIVLSSQGQYYRNDSVVLSSKTFDSSARTINLIEGGVPNLSDRNYNNADHDFSTRSLDYNWDLKSIIKIPNGYRYVFLAGRIPFFRYTFDYDTISKRQSIVNIKETYIEQFSRDLDFKKGYFEYGSFGAPITSGATLRYLYNSDYSDALRYNNDSNLVKVPSYIYLNNRLRLLTRFSPNWFNENLDGRIFLFGTAIIKDSGMFRAVLPLENLNLKIKGNVFNDVNSNCHLDAGEKKAANFVVSGITSSLSYPVYTTTDINGNYEILTDTGLTKISVRPNVNYPFLINGNCSDTQFLYANNSTEFDSINFGLKTGIQCPYNTVNISTYTPFRIGRQQTYTVSYCNNGSVPSANTYITVKLDSLLDFNSASIPYTALTNHTYRFNIGNLDYFKCGSFSLIATPRISGVQLNQTLCAVAHIYPDTICVTPNYTGPVIQASAQCAGDSVRLQLQNIGRGNMNSPKNYIVIEGNVMRINRPYQLNANQILTETLLAANGQTYRIVAEQPDELPASYGDKFTTAAIENCHPVQNFPTGYFTQFPNYDGEPYRAVTCNVITGSYDPNDKVATPLGYASQHYIEPNTQIDYQINFQNTGNDTAFKVVLIDTIAPTLDINSIQLGVASHRYQFLRTDTNVVKFVFDSINLVDSFRNEALSHGFVKFKIQQKKNNPIGTKIYNQADIYFDYNLPVITNKTMHTVGLNFVQVSLINDVKNIRLNVKDVMVMPNPFSDKARIIVESDPLRNPLLLLMNAEGKVIRTIGAVTQNTFEIYREDLSSGWYIYKIVQSEDLVATGKIVVQ